MDGNLSGLDWAAALVSLPSGIDVDLAKRLLAAAEAAFVSAWWAFAEGQKADKTPKKD